MACSQCGETHDRNHCPIVNFRMDGTILVPYLNGIAGEGVDLQNAITGGQYNSNLKLDMDNNRLVLNSDSTSPDNIPLANLAGLISLDNLSDVVSSPSTDGDLLSYDADSNMWISYTVPSGTPISTVGVDADGKLVKGNLSGDQGSATLEVPIGASLEWTGPVLQVPSNFMLMNGQEISRAVYSDYYNLIGTMYGGGNGTTTFNIPNRNGRVGVGYNPDDTTFSTIGATGGEKAHALSTAELPPHSHSINPPATTTSSDTHSHNIGKVGTSGSGYGLLDGSSNTSSGTKYTSSDTHSHSVNIPTFNSANTGSGTAHNNMPPYIVFPYIVRVI